MFATAERVELAALWEELVMGTSKIERWSHTAETWSVVVSRSPGPLCTTSGARDPRARANAIGSASA